MGCAPSKEEPGQIALKDVQADVAINSGRRMTETKRRIAVRAETTDLEEAFTPPTYPKSEDAKDRIRQGVVQNAQGDGLLKELTAQQKEDMINAMIEVTCKAGDLVIKQGEQAKTLFCILEGECRIMRAILRDYATLFEYVDSREMEHRALAADLEAEHSLRDRTATEQTDGGTETAASAAAAAAAAASRRTPRPSWSGARSSTRRCSRECSAAARRTARSTP